MARWGSASRDADGTFNFAGVADPAVDAMIDAIVKARTRAEFVDAVRAYDRLLLSGAYVVPLYFQPDQWVARWAHQTPGNDAYIWLSAADLVAARQTERERTRR